MCSSPAKSSPVDLSCCFSRRHKCNSRSKLSMLTKTLNQVLHFASHSSHRSCHRYIETLATSHRLQHVTASRPVLDSMDEDEQDDCHRPKCLRSCSLCWEHKKSVHLGCHSLSIISLLCIPVQIAKLSLIFNPRLCEDVES